MSFHDVSSPTRTEFTFSAKIRACSPIGCNAGECEAVDHNQVHNQLDVPRRAFSAHPTLMSHLAELAIAVGGGLVAIVFAVFVGARVGRRELLHRLDALNTRLGDDSEGVDSRKMEPVLARLERAAGRAAEAIAETSADAIRLRRVLDALPQGVVICDESSNVVFQNSPARAIMDDSRYGEALAAQTVHDLLASTWESAGGERALDLYGPPRRTLTVRTQLIDDGRRTVGAMAVIEDITDMRHLEEVRRDFVANVSHELKTPVGAIGILTETLLAETDPSVAVRLARRIHSEAFRVARIIDDLLDLSRIESEEAPPREPRLLARIIKEALEGVASLAERDRVILVPREPFPQVVVQGDRRQLLSALHNLLENAIKFSYEDSEVEITCDIEDGHVAVCIRDNGMGIPAREMDRIFERFYRGEHGRDHNTDGTGLGLSIVRHVVSNHRGRVDVESREGEGSAFTIHLPLEYSTSASEPGAGDDAAHPRRGFTSRKNTRRDAIAAHGRHSREPSWQGDFPSEDDNPSPARPMDNESVTPPDASTHKDPAPDTVAHDVGGLDHNPGGDDERGQG